MAKKKQKKKNESTAKADSSAPTIETDVVEEPPFDFYAVSEEDGQQLEGRARTLAKAGGDEFEDVEVLELVTFPVGEERYAIEITSIREVRPLKRGMWAPVPCTPIFIVGVANIRGQLYSVMDIGEILGLPAREFPEAPYVLLVEGAGPDGEMMELCILADDEGRGVRVKRSDINPDSSTISEQTKDFVLGVTKDMLIVLDLGKLLSSPNIIISENK